MAQNFADTSTSTKVAALVGIGIQAFADRDVAKLETCLKDILKAVRKLQKKLEYEGHSYDSEESVDFYEEYERMTQLRGTRLPELIRNCMNQEDNPQAFFLVAEINLTLDHWHWRSIDDDKLCLDLIPEKLFWLMSNYHDLEVINKAYMIMGETIRKAEERGEMDPVSNPLLGPPFVDILLRIGMQYPEKFTFRCCRMGIPTFLKDKYCTTRLGVARATEVIQKVLNVAADIIANETASPALLVFGLKCFSSVSTAEKQDELRIMINLWIQEAIPRFTNFLDHPDHGRYGVQVAAMEAFADVIISSPQAAKQVVDDGIFVRVAETLNREEFDVVGDKALRLLWICIRKKPEDLVMEGIFQAQIPVILTQRLLLRAKGDFSKGVAQLCIQKICEFIPLTLAKNLLESGAVLEWLNYIKEDPYTLSRFHLLRAILKHLAPTLKNGHTPSFQALTQIISETIGLDVAQNFEVVEDPEDLDIESWDDDYDDGRCLSTTYDYYDSDREIDSDSDSD